MKLRNIFLGFLFLILLVLSAFGNSNQEISHFPFLKNSVINSDYGNCIIIEQGINDHTILNIAEFNLPLIKTNLFSGFEKKIRTKMYSGVKTLSCEEPELFSIRNFVSLLLMTHNCGYLTISVENRVSDFSPELLSSILITLFNSDLKLFDYLV